MNLIVEQGNSAVKIAVYQRGTLIKSAVYHAFDTSGLAPWFEQYPLANGIYSTVTDPDNALMDAMSKQLSRFIFFDSQVKLPIAICYQTLDTLGKDRIAAAVGANYMRPGADLLVIDAGTAITYELIDASGMYLGGNISPGLTTRFKALHYFTARLPLVEETEHVPLVGISTETALVAGVVNGIAYEMDGHIQAIRNRYPDIFVFLTGGHSFYFERRLKNVIFVAINLVLTGLNRILEYNVEAK